MIQVGKSFEGLIIVLEKNIFIAFCLNLKTCLNSNTYEIMEQQLIRILCYLWISL